MALLRGTLESVDGKTVYATCEHHKVNIPILPEHVEARKMMRLQGAKRTEIAKL
jgi:hypothetical protein